MNRNLKVGLGVGCGVVALLFLVLLGGGVWFAREMGREYKVVQETEDELVAAVGESGSWTPPPGLVPPPERVAAFADVRTGLSQWRTRLGAGAVRFAAARKEGRGVGGIWNQMRAGSDLGLLFAGFWSARNRLLLDVGMGPDEYVWLYGLVYYGWLGEDPGAGAAALEMKQGRGVRVQIDAGSHDDPVRQARLRARTLLASLLERAEPSPLGTVTADALAAERARMREDPLRVPWQDGVPESLAAAFEPHRDALTAAWDGTVNPVELLFDVGNSKGAAGRD